MPKENSTPHQVDGVLVAFGKELAGYKLGGILGDDPGLGKTIQIAALIYGNKANVQLKLPGLYASFSIGAMEGGYELCVEGKRIHSCRNKRAKGSEIKEQCNGKSSLLPVLTQVLL